MDKQFVCFVIASDPLQLWKSVHVEPRQPCIRPLQLNP